MCSMFWQLNDVWAAPSWSSIDFDLRWKPLMYHVKRFFSDIAVFLDARRNNLKVNIINDKNYDINNVTLKIYTFAWKAGLKPIYSEKIPVPVLPKLSAIDVKYPHRINGVEEYLIVASIISGAGEKLSPLSYLYPDKLFNSPTINNTLKIEQITVVDENSYKIILKCKNAIPLVWVDLSEEVKRTNPDIVYEFSDNSFSMIRSRKTITLKIVKNPYNTRLTKTDLVACFLDTCGFSDTKKHKF
uniref:Beta-mannosidase n=1 Tax=Strongyloides venezuelensis TaxID=75913 RepID=A0A0K0G1L2_STRVS